MVEDAVMNVVPILVSESVPVFLDVDMGSPTERLSMVVIIKFVFNPVFVASGGRRGAHKGQSVAVAVAAQFGANRMPPKPKLISNYNSPQSVANPKANYGARMAEAVCSAVAKALRKAMPSLNMA